MKVSHPPAVTRDLAPTGYEVIHRFRSDDYDGGGVALVYATQLRAVAVPYATELSGENVST